MRLVPPSPKAGLAVAGLMVGALWGAWLAWGHLEGRASVLDRLEPALLDLRFSFAGPRPPPPGIAIVSIGEETARAEGGYPLSRAALARLLRQIASAGPRAIGLDILFLDPMSAGGDEDLIAAVRDTGAVLAAAALFPDAGFRQAERADDPGLSPDIPIGGRVLRPFGKLAEAPTGLVNLSADRSGVPRHVPLLVKIGEELFPSFTLRVTSQAARADPVLAGETVRLGRVASVTDLGRFLPLRYYGPRGTIPTVEALEVLQGVGPDRLRDRIVLVGAAVIGSGDTFPTPFDPVMPGVEVLATATAHLAAGDGLVRSSRTRLVDAGFAIGLPLGAVLLLSLPRTGLGLGLLGALLAAWGLACLLAFEHGYWLTVAVPLAAVIPVAFLYGGARLWAERTAERRLTAVQDVLRSFQPSLIAQRLIAEPGYLTEPVEQDAAVLFVDLSGFTALSESLGEAAARDLLVRFHETVEQVVTGGGGMVLNYMGDGALIVFGVPERGENDASRALTVATELIRVVETWLSTLPNSARPGGVRVGAHYGPVVLSRLGATTNQQITVTGDTVNVASRLLAVASREETRLAASEALFAAAASGGEREPSEFSGPVATAIRGRTQPLAVRLWRASAPVAP